MKPELPHIVVVVAAGDADQAWTIAKTAVEKRLAACAQVFPVRSCYVWEGKIAEDNEYLVFIKSRREVYDQLEACVRQIHSYEVPEIIAIPITAGSQAYLWWIDETVMTGRS